jgi:hypothetical protein
MLLLLFPVRYSIHQHAALKTFVPFGCMSMQTLRQEHCCSFLWKVAAVTLVITHYVHTRTKSLLLLLEFFSRTLSNV